MSTKRGTSNNDLGERVAAIDATLKGLDKYSHERWHDLANHLQPLITLPEKMTREIGRLQGTIDGRIATVLKDVERSIEGAIERALKPITDNIDRLEKKVDAQQDEIEALKETHSQFTGGRAILVWIGQTIASALAAIAAVLAMNGRGP